MANVLLTPQLLTKLTLMNLGDSLYVCRNMSKAYTDQFGKKGAKAGDTYFVRRPQRFQVTKGLGYQPQPITDTQVPITVSEVAGVHFEFDSIERTLSLDFIQERYAKPAAIALANQINTEAAKYIALNTFNMVGTPGTAPTTMNTYLSAEDLLVAQGCPQNEELVAIINRKMSSAYIGSAAISGAFNSQKIIGAQMEQGRIQQQLGYRWEIDQTIYTHTTGAQGGTPLLNGGTLSADGGNNGTMTLTTNGWSNSITVLKAGDVITLAGVNSVHPQTRVDTSYKQQFTVLSDVISDGSGNASISVFPAITPSGQYQNVSAAPGSTAAITVWGGTAGQYASQSSPQGLLLHKDAFAFMSVPLENPDEKGVEMVATETDPDTGMTLSFIRAFDPISRKHVNRFDTLYGFGRLYAELACRIAA